MNTIVIILIALTVVTSIAGFNNSEFFDRGKFNVGAILYQKQWDRLLFSVFLHADWLHLFFNMFTLYVFSDEIIRNTGEPEYLLVYFAAALGGNLLSLLIYRRNPHYSAIGASGGVSGILFASIAINPFTQLYVFPLPIPISGWLFGVLYLAYSIYGMKAQLGNIGHAAHLGGASIGLLFAVIFLPGLLEVNGLYVAVMLVPLIALGYYIYKS
ncbi:MAG: rhomboid family intramembrane serine protease [Prevotella sp.]|jgi:membrane associated rhomboid family serine protease|nr:rhomboid family intramembrane serine protease [Prevotella sp.]